jgi:putative effector of murein hydrolase
MSPSEWHVLPVFLSTSPLLWLTFTLAAYVVGGRIQRWLKGNALANPVLLAIIFVGAALKWTGVPYQTYFSGAQFIHFLLGPATVALAVPLVNNLHHIRQSLGPLLVALLAGSLASAVSGYGLVRLLGGTQEVALSMMPKAATTPIAIGVAQAVGGLPSLTAVLAIAGGVIAAISIQKLMSWFRIEDWRASGLAAGTAGSGIGAAQVIPLHDIAGAFAGVAIGLNGLMTSILVPLLAHLLPAAKHG